jgi:tetratricopeptide (TPR) repeat protein
MKQHENNLKILKILRYVLVAFFIFFLIINLISSQTISSIFFKFVNNDRAATVSFLQKIKVLPDYQNILRMHDNIYGKSIRVEIDSEESKKKALINNLEQQLTINPKARDILYSLYQLYLAEGDKKKANYYLQQAIEVDPSIVK